MNYSVTFDDGGHNTTLEEFMSLDEAFDFYHEQVRLFKTKADDFYKQFLTEEYDAVLEVCKLDEDGFYDDTIEVFDKDYDMWWLPWGTSVLQCSLHDYTIHATITLMFFQVSNVQSSNIEELYINPTTSEVIVDYKSGGSYSYTNVDRVAIDDLLYARADVSLGQWVNTHLAKSSGVICDNLDALIRNIQREPIAAWL